jgi:LacI family transcriptional regulator
MYDRSVTLRDISRKTGYSVNTVSRALRGKADIAPETREKIRAAADEMGYVVNSMASSLRSGRTGLVAVIVSDISNPLFGILVKDIETALIRENYCAMILNTDENEEKEKRALYHAISKKVDGIILCPAQRSDGNIRLLKRSGIPFVLQGRRMRGIETDYVVWDDVGGAYLATRYLLSQGKRSILYLTAPLYISSARERYEGYCKALAEAGIEPEPGNLLVMDDFDNDAGMECALRRLDRVSAVFAFNDVLALKLLETIRRLPQCRDIPVIGFDNIQSRLHIPYPLSSVHTPKKLMAEQVCRFLMGRIRHTVSAPLQASVIPTQLCLRAEGAEDRYLRAEDLKGPSQNPQFPAGIRPESV